MSFRPVPPSLPPTPGSGQSLRRALEVGAPPTTFLWTYTDFEKAFDRSKRLYVAFQKLKNTNEFAPGHRFWMPEPHNFSNADIETLKSMIEKELRKNGWPDKHQNYNADFSVTKVNKGENIDEFLCFLPQHVAPPKEFSKNRHSETSRSQSMPSARDYSMRTNLK